MRGDRQSLDLVVRSEDGLSLVLGASEVAENRLVLVGTLVDPESPPRVDATIQVAFARELIEGAHVPRVTDILLVVDEVETLLTWEVETRELGDGYALQDARVASSAGAMRAFAIEDLAASAGVGIAVGIAGLLVWRNHRREKWAREEANRKWEQCLKAGRSPSWVYTVEDEAALEARGPRITSRARYAVRCDPA